MWTNTVTLRRHVFLEAAEHVIEKAHGCMFTRLQTLREFRKRNALTTQGKIG